MPQKNITLYSILLLLLFGCTTTTNTSIHKIPVDNKYDSEFPSISVSNELSYISKTVKKLDVLTFYATYYFPPDSYITRNSINDSILKVYSNSVTITHESVSGTASVIYNTLVTETDIANKSKINSPYMGDIFVDNNKLISYGITYSVSIDEIVTFISSNETCLITKGFDINSFFK